MAKNEDSSKFSMYSKDSMYAKTVKEQNAAQPGLYPAECNGCYSDVPAEMHGDKSNLQAAP